MNYVEAYVQRKTTRDWESVFTTWSQGPSATEQGRAENAERQIRQAVQDSDKLKNRNIRVFTQGSYRNRVNVRRDSDVDIGVLCFDTCFPEYPRFRPLLGSYSQLG